MIELTEEQTQALENAATTPPRVVNPKTKETFVLVKADDYDRQNGSTDTGRGTAEWTDDKNRRRGELVDKEIDGIISAAEQAELDMLQAEMLAYRRKVAPLQLDELRVLHRELLRESGDEKV